MEEIEVKILDIDEEEIRNRLNKLAGSARVSLQEISYYDFPDHRLQSDDACLRVRIERDTSVITYKVPISKEGYKIMDETELVIGNPQKMGKILELLGLMNKMQLKKHREKYTFEGCEVDIDKLEGLPAYLEIEGTKQAILHVMKILDIDESKKTSMSVFDVLEHYKK